MGRRREAAWWTPFVEALAVCGSVEKAADAAGVDKSSAYYSRKAHPAFAARWDEALAAARARLDRGEVPPLACDEIVRSSRHGRPCVMKVGPGRWSAAKEAVFLAALEEGANARRAAKAAGLSREAVYARRRREPRFAADWAAAVRSGYLDVEALLIENMKTVLGDAPAESTGPDEPKRLTGGMTVADAINVLRLHRASVKGGAPQRYDWRAQEPDIETVRAEVLRKVAAMERRGRG